MRTISLVDNKEEDSSYIKLSNLQSTKERAPEHNYSCLGPNAARCASDATFDSSVRVKPHSVCSNEYSFRVFVWLNNELSQQGTILTECSKNERAGWSPKLAIEPVWTLLLGQISIVIPRADSMSWRFFDRRAATPWPIPEDHCL